MGYRNSLIHIDLAEQLGEEYDGLWVKIRNPKILPQSVLMPPDVKLGPDGLPDLTEATSAGFKVIAGIIADWNLPDPLDEADDPQPMPLGQESAAKIPVAVAGLLGKRIAEAVDPQ